MEQGKLEGIYIVAQSGGAPRSVGEARAIEGCGLEGDRHFRRVRSGAEEHDPGDELTLIEAESIEALARDYDVRIGPGESRRNLVTRGVALNHLVGREFRVGEVRARGIRLCEPCGHLAGLTRKEVLRGLIHRGGLRAQILEGGTVRVGDPIVPAEPPFAPSAAPTP